MRSMVAIPSMPRPIMPIICIIPIECIADMLLIMFFMSFIGMPPCGAAVAGPGAGFAGADFSVFPEWE
jgi:hypothetical protein